MKHQDVNLNSIKKNLEKTFYSMPTSDIIQKPYAHTFTPYPSQTSPSQSPSSSSSSSSSRIPSPYGGAQQDLDDNTMKVCISMKNEMRDSSHVILESYYRRIEVCNEKLSYLINLLESTDKAENTSTLKCYICPYKGCGTTKYWKNIKTWENHVGSVHKDVGVKLPPEVHIIRYGYQYPVDILETTMTTARVSPTSMVTANTSPKKRKIFSGESGSSDTEPNEGDEDCGRMSINALCNPSEQTLVANTSAIENYKKQKTEQGSITSQTRTLYSIAYDAPSKRESGNTSHIENRGSEHGMRRDEVEEQIVKIERYKASLEYIKNQLLDDLLNKISAYKFSQEEIRRYCLDSADQKHPSGERYSLPAL